VTSIYPQYQDNPPDVRKLSTADLIRKIGSDSAVLVKNVHSALPLSLKATRKIAIVGADAGPNAFSSLAGGGSGKYPLTNENGTLTLGGGSGWALPPYVVTPNESINYRARKAGAQVWTTLNDTAYAAVNLTVTPADVALVFVSAYAVEGQDRLDLRLDREGETLIWIIAANNKNTVVVMQ
jgi:beta-glucosidase